MNDALVRRGLPVLLILLALFPPAAMAAPTAQFWEEIGGSATGGGISNSELGVVPEHRNASIVIGSDGRPVVAYTDWADIVVKRWNGAIWEEIARPGGGHLPQIVMDASGRLYLGWMEFIPATESWEVYLLTRDAAGGDWQELGGSATGGGISGADGPANVNSFSLAVSRDGTPWVAYDTTPTAGTDFTVDTQGIAADQDQVYVKRWAGPVDGWMYAGSGREGGGATSAPSFVFSNPDGSANLARHGALSPALAVRADGTPVLAFIYTSAFSNGTPAEFNGLNDDVYALTWDGTAWLPMGPAIPTQPAGAGLGGPGGISNDGGWSVEAFLNRINRPYMIIARDGAPVLGWGETSDADGLRHVFVRRWNGTAWAGLGSASGEIARSAVAFDVSLAPGVNGPLAAWGGGAGADSSIYVLAYDSRTGRWSELGAGSASGAGISAPSKRGFTPWITLDPGGVPTVSWIQAPDIESSGQTYVRTFEPRGLADLTVTALTAPASMRTGGTLAVTSTVRNLGVLASPSTPMTFYLSTGTTRSADDVLLGSRTIPILPVNGTSTATVSFVLPPRVEPGTYFVLGIVDEASAVAERNESNNARASAAINVFLFRSDLQFTALRVPPAAAPGRPLAITSTVRNTGPAPATAFAVRYYLSTDPDLNDGDVLLVIRPFPGLAAGGTSTVVTTVTIPVDTAIPNDYWIVALVDSEDQQVELDESNNLAAAGPIRVTEYKPELSLTALSMPAAGATGRPLAITSSVRNTGPAPAGAFTIRLYLSADAALDASDVLLGSRAVAGLAPGVTSTAVTTVMIPLTTPVPASYRIIAVADALERQVELDEGNNTLVSTGTVALTLYRPELSVTAVSMPATGATGRPLAITHTVRNGGPAPAGAFTVRFYLSTDTTFDNSDVLLGSRVIGGLAAGVSSTAVTTLTVPIATSAGDYHVIAVADVLNQQAELDESNNTFASPTTVAIALFRSDLVLTALSVPAAGGAAGRPLAITNAVRNLGPAPAGAFTVRFYLSADNVQDASDVLLGSRVIGSLAANASSSTVTSLVIPATTPVPASYRVVAVVDALGQQTEMQEGNNTMATDPVTIRAYQPDLTLESVSAPAAVTAGRSLTITHVTRNDGTAPTAGAFTVRFYLSTDATQDGSDILLGTRALPAVAAGGRRTDVTVLTVPASVAPGTYRILGVVDALGQQKELDENNNLTASGSITVASPS